MKLQKNDYLKIVILLAICAGIICVLFLFSGKDNAKIKNPEFASLEKMLLPSSRAPGEEIIKELSRLAEVNKERRNCDEVAALAQKVIDSGKVRDGNLIFTRFTRYSALFAGEKISDASLEVEKMLAMDLPPAVRGAMLGEKARCMARLQGLPAALKYLNAENVRASAAPEIRPFLNKMYASLLCENGKRPEAVAKLLACAGDPGCSLREKEDYLTSAAILLSGMENPWLILKKVYSKISPQDYFRLLDMAASMLIRQGKYADAAKIYEACLSDKKNPANFRKIAEIKLEICREKQNSSAKKR